MTGNVTPIQKILCLKEEGHYNGRRQELLADIAAARQVEIQPLLADLQRFGLQYHEIHELVDEPENTLALAIDRIADYLQIFEDAGNLFFLFLILGRPEGKGLVATRLMDFFETANSRNLTHFSEDTLFQAARAISKTATKADAKGIFALVSAELAGGVTQKVLIRTASKLLGKASVPFLCELNLRDKEAQFEVEKQLGKFGPT